MRRVFRGPAPFGRQGGAGLQQLFLLATAEKLGAITETKRFDFACTAIEWHFAGIPRTGGRNLAAVSRTHARRRSGGGGQTVLEPAHSVLRHSRAPPYETLTFASLTPADNPLTLSRRRNTTMWRSAKQSRSNASIMAFGCVAPNCATRSCSLLARIWRKNGGSHRDRGTCRSGGRRIRESAASSRWRARLTPRSYRGKILLRWWCGL